MMILYVIMITEENIENKSINIHRCFWCNAMEFTKKIKVPIGWSPTKTMGTLIFFCEFCSISPKTCILYQISGDFGRKLNFIQIFCNWLIWKTLTWLVYQILGDFGRKLKFIQILYICLIWKILTWLVYQISGELGGNSMSYEFCAFAWFEKLWHD